MHKKVLFSLLFCSLVNAQDVVKQLDDYLNEHNQAFQALAPIAPNITHHTTTHYGARETITIHHYQYPDQQAKNTHEAYKTALQNLEQEIVKNSAGDGFIQGVLLAVANRLVSGKKINKGLTTSGIIFPSILWTLYQNKNSVPTPYYSVGVARESNLFANMSFLTFGRMCMSMLGATAGFFGTAYTIERLENLINRRQNNAQPNQAVQHT